MKVVKPSRVGLGSAIFPTGELFPRGCIRICNHGLLPILTRSSAVPNPLEFLGDLHKRPMRSLEGGDVKNFAGTAQSTQVYRDWW